MNERRAAISQKATGALCSGSRVGCGDLDSAGGTPAVTDWLPYARRERGKSNLNRRR